MKKVKFFIIFIIFFNSVNLFSQEEYEDTEESFELVYEDQALTSQPQVQTQAQTADQTQIVRQTQPVKQPQPPVQYAPGRQNLTPEIINLVLKSGKNLKGLNFYLSKPFKMVIKEQPYDTPQVDIQNGTLIIAYGGQSQTILFDSKKPGKLQGFPVSGSMDVFEVIFRAEGRDVALKFKKNKNYFELFSAVIDTRSYTLYSDDIIQLAINLNADDEVETSAVDGGRGFVEGRGLVEGRGSLEKAGITAYVKRQNPSIDDNFLNRLIDTYIAEAAFENINHDIAIAQMLYTTSFLKNGKFASSYNYAGLSPLQSWDGRFASMTEGVRAHIQHIKGYASTTINNRQIVDPRYYLLVNLRYLGTVKTFDQLYVRWSANPANYKKNIEIILDGLSRR